MDKTRLNILEEVLKIVSTATLVSIEEMKQKTSIRRVTDARFMYCAYMQKQTDVLYNLDEIGLPLNYSHAMVLHGKKVVANYSFSEKQFFDKYNHIIQEVQNSAVVNYLIAVYKEEHTALNFEELQSAIKLLKDKLALLRSWLVENPKNPYRQQVLRDVREWDAQLAVKQRALHTMIEKQKNKIA